MFGIVFVGRDIIRILIFLIVFFMCIGVLVSFFFFKYLIFFVFEILILCLFIINFLEIIELIDFVFIILNFIIFFFKGFVYKRIILFKVI